MRVLTSLLFAAILGTSATLAVAQEATEAPETGTAPAAAEETTAPEAAPDADTTTEDAPATQEATPSEPPEKVVAVHGDWQVRCREDNGTCFMYQLAIDARDIPIAEMSIVPLNANDDRVAGFTVVTPLRTLLTEGVTLQIDNGRQQKYQFGWCTEAGCAARFAVRSDGLAQFKRGNKARITVLSVEKPDAPVILDVSLKGFTAAFNDLSER